MNYENSRPVGATVLPEARGRTKPDNGECNIWFNSYIKCIRRI